MLNAVIYRAGYLFAHYAAHASANKGKIHAGYHQILSAQLAVRSADGIVQFGLVHCCHKAVGIFLGVFKT